MVNTSKKSSKKDDAHLADFEKQLAELEKIVAEMEAGNMTLEDSLKAYEKGIRLTRECQAALDSAQQRIQILSEKNGILNETPFDNSESSSE